MTNGAWDYFSKDVKYSDLLKERLASGIEMDSAKALGSYLDEACEGDLRVVDFGSGPGHYLPVIKQRYTKGKLDYLGVDIDASNIEYGSRFFAGNPDVRFRVGSLLQPDVCVAADVNCVISANTLPHVPTIEPLLELLALRVGIEFFVFRMLVGGECVQIKKHLRQHDFDALFERDYQLNNIYSLEYIQHGLGRAWNVEVRDDVFDPDRLEHHKVPAQDADAFYGNRVSRAVGSMVFKGDVYMPWKFVIGRRDRG